MNTDQYNQNTDMNQQSTGFDQQQNTGFDQQQSTGLGGQQNTGFDQQQSTGLGGQQNTGFDQQQSTGLGGMNSGYDQQQGGLSDAGNAYSSGGLGGQDTTQAQTTGDYPISSQDPSMTQSSATDPMSQGGFNTTASGQDPTQTQDNSWDSSNTQGNVQSSNDPLNASGNNQSFGDSNQNMGQNIGQSGDPSAGDKIKGTMKKMAGKIQNDPSKVAEGEQLKQGGDSNLM